MSFLFRSNDFERYSSVCALFFQLSSRQGHLAENMIPNGQVYIDRFKDLKIEMKTTLELNFMGVYK